MAFKKVTLKTIAERANVSRGTVDRALNNRGRICSKTQENILKIATELGYRPNILAKTLSTNKTYRIAAVIPEDPAYIPNDAPDETRGFGFYSVMAQGMKDAVNELADYGIELRFSYCERLNPYFQGKVLEQIDVSKVDGVVFNPAHSMLNPYIDNFVQHGIPVITFNSDVIGSGRSCYIGQNMREAGGVAGELMGKFLHRKGRVLILTSYTEVESLIERCDGFMSVIRNEYPNIKVIGPYSCKEDIEEAEKKVLEYYQDDPEIEGIFTVNGSSTLGAIKAMKKLKLENPPIFIGWDAVEMTQQAIRDGIVTATICQEPYSQGYHAIRYMVKMLTEGWKPPKEFFYTRIKIAVKHNLDSERWEKDDHNII